VKYSSNQIFHKEKIKISSNYIFTSKKLFMKLLFHNEIYVHLIKFSKGKGKEKKRKEGWFRQISHMEKKKEEICF
jgi:hypothetical protein